MKMDSEYQDFPLISEHLIEALDSRFPERVPDGDDLSSIRRLQGQVSVVRLLKEVRDTQVESNLVTKG